MAANKIKLPYVIRFSSTHGHGAFATRQIRKGTCIIEYLGKRSSWNSVLKRPASDPNNPYHTFIFEVSDGKVIDARIDGNAARWINHSCEPNCETLEDDDGRVFIYATRTIRIGEELTYDYHLSIEGRVSKRMKKAYACLCGADICRGTMLALQ